MIASLFFIIISYIYLACLTKKTNEIFCDYEKRLLESNERIPIKFRLGGKTGFPSTERKKIIIRYKKNKNKNHLISLLWSLVLSEGIMFWMVLVYSYVLIIIFANIVDRGEYMHDYIIKLIIIDLVFLLLISFTYYMLFLRHIKNFNIMKSNFIEYLRSIADIETISRIKRFDLFINKLSYLMKVYAETKNDEYMLYAIEYFCLYRNKIYIFLFFAVLVLFNCIYLLH